MASHLLTEVEKRACITLSELFLDIELTDLILDRMALSFQQLNLPIPSLDHILRNDLFSILYPNLMSVAGTWTGFDANWLINQVESHPSHESGEGKTIVTPVDILSQKINQVFRCFFEH